MKPLITILLLLCTAIVCVPTRSVSAQNVTVRDDRRKKRLAAPRASSRFDAPTTAAAKPKAGQQANVRIRLPERFRLLTDQRFDFRVEATGLINPTIKIIVDGADVTAQMPAPELTADEDGNAASLDRAWTFRQWSFARPGTREIQVTVADGGRSHEARARVGVQLFRPSPDLKNVVFFVGDGMGTAYRDAARIVAKSANGKLREGFYDELLQMDQMPVSGMILTHSLDRLAPDSADTASAWSTGNKTVAGAFGVLPDNNDRRFNPGDLQNTKRFALDNPRVETLWEYLRRRHDYRTGIVTTADVTDATTAAAAAHSAQRALFYDVARQFVDGSVTPGIAFDVILGGGRERFSARNLTNSGDTRDLVAELRAAGYAHVQTRAELKARGDDLLAGRPAPAKLLGLFRTGNMNVAFDRLRLPRPVDEPAANLDGANDQPFLDEMTAAALATLRRSERPFILLVEAASIDKQSHSNHAIGQIWDTIELDRAVGVARRFVSADDKLRARTLLVATADHDQSMTLMGTIDTQHAAAVENVRSTQPYPAPPPGSDEDDAHSYMTGEVAGFPDYVDADNDGYPENANRLRLGVGYRTPNHTASSVPLTAEGAGALLFTGYYDQTDIFFRIARALASNTTALDETLNNISEGGK